MTEPGQLSLAAELLLLSIDPAHGGLLPGRRRRRLRKALGVARRVDDPGARDLGFLGWTAGRAARRELVTGGLVEPKLLLRNLRLTELRPAGPRFRALWRCIEEDELSSRRDRDLAVLLASSGVLAERLTSHQRWIAWRRLKGVMALDEAGVRSAPLTGAAPLSFGIAALGSVALHGIEGLVTDAVGDAVSGLGDGDGSGP
jgi:hypothetical protein